MGLIEIIGWIGGMLFAFCGVPQAIRTYKTQHAKDISWLFMWMWVFGEIFTLIYVLDNNLMSGKFQYPLLANYFFNTIIVSFIMYVKWKSEPWKGVRVWLKELTSKVSELF